MICRTDNARTELSVCKSSSLTTMLSSSLFCCSSCLLSASCCACKGSGAKPVKYCKAARADLLRGQPLAAYRTPLEIHSLTDTLGKVHHLLSLLAVFLDTLLLHPVEKTKRNVDPLLPITRESCNTTALTGNATHCTTVHTAFPTCDRSRLPPKSTGPCASMYLRLCSSEVLGLCQVPLWPGGGVDACLGCPGDRCGGGG